MDNKLSLVTGATGLLGSHIVERLRQNGERVRALARPQADTAFLRQLEVEIAPGDLLVPASVATAVAGADIVYHCAARVGNWGTWKDFRTSVIDSTENLLDKCVAAGVGRLLYVSSLAAYGLPRLPANGGQIDENETLGQNLGFLDYYSRAKERAERIVRAFGPKATIVRPSWIYGPAIATPCHAWCKRCGPAGCPSWVTATTF